MTRAKNQDRSFPGFSENRDKSQMHDLFQVVERVERAVQAVQRTSDDTDLYLDSAALNLHDFYAGLERVFRLIATQVEQSIPRAAEWHGELLHQMGTDVTGVRPAVLSGETVAALDEYLRFRHVVRNVYAVSFERERIERLAERVRPLFEQVRDELLSFAEVLDGLAHADE